MIRFNNGIIQTDKTEQEIRSLIMDGELPVYKIIGFTVNIYGKATQKSTALSSHNSRDIYRLDNNIEIARMLSSAIILPDSDEVFLKGDRSTYMHLIAQYTTDEDKRYVLSEKDLKVRNGSERQACRFVTKEPIAFKFITNDYFEGTVRFLVRYHNKFIGLSDNYSAIERNVIANNDDKMYKSINKDYYPLESEAYIGDYVRILPDKVNGQLQYRYNHGMSDEFMNTLMMDYERGESTYAQHSKRQ